MIPQSRAARFELYLKLARAGSLCVLFAMLPFAHAGDLKLRTRVEPYKGSGDWREVEISQGIDPAHTAIVICDMWDKHWCRGSDQRVGELAKRMNPVLEKARARGVLIIHAPSETMDFYRGVPQRDAILSLAKGAPAPVLDAKLDFKNVPPLPIDDSAGGCETGDKEFKAWTRETPLLRVADNDLVSDNGTEIYGVLKLRGINQLLVMGVHTNMCILNRTFAIKQMTKWGVRCILVRDLTDSMYDPQTRPFVTHDQGTELVIEHIEKYWCPTALSGDLLLAIR
jgi:nicotinamidase-related amidase